MLPESLSGGDFVFPIEPIVGADEDDVLEGSDENDILEGNGGSDVLIGFGGDDTLTGGIGDDELDGANGSDTYIYNRGDGSDIIFDYDIVPQIDLDRLVFTDLNITDLNFAIETIDPDSEFSIENSLIIEVSGTSDTISIAAQFAGEQEIFDPFTSGPQIVIEGIDEIEFADGLVIDRQDIVNIINGDFNTAPPVTGTVLVDQSATEDTGVSFALPVDAFSDIDGDELTFSATLADGTALPLSLIHI